MRIKLFLDSGAFTAHRNGGEVDLFSYIDFLGEYESHVTAYASLDVIPPPSGGPDGVDEAARQGWENYRTMVRCGLDPIPVYHGGERRYWLEKYIGEGATYIGLGGMARSHAAAKEAWLSDVFSWLADHAPKVKTHAFGITSTNLLFDYPFYSADSTSWEIHGGFGRVMFPAPIKVDGEWVPDYSKPPMSIKTSDRESKMGPAFRGVGVEVREYVDAQVEEMGLTHDLLRDDRTSRIKGTIRYFLNMSGSRRFRRKRYDGQGFFNRNAIDTGERNPILYFTATNGSSARLVIGEGARHILVSYEYAGKDWVKKVMRMGVGHHV